MNNLNDFLSDYCRGLVRTMNKIIASDPPREFLLAFVEEVRDGLAVIVGNPDVPEPIGIIKVEHKACQQMNTWFENKSDVKSS